jgi:hypothetical protein
MPLWDAFAALGAYTRVTTALAPFALAMLLRAAFGRNRFTGWLLSISTMWFLLNVLLAPYSPGMREDFQSIQSLLR